MNKMAERLMSDRRFFLQISDDCNLVLAKNCRIGYNIVKEYINRENTYEF